MTDHDTVAGLASAAERATSRGVIFVPGIELTTYEHGQVIHVLGYGFEPSDEGLAERNAIAQQVWGDNQRRWIDALREAGHELNYERDFRGPLRLPVLIERLCLAGVSGGDPRACHREFRAFFAALPSSAYAALATPAQAASVIRKAGGVAVLAHPYSLSSETLISTIAKTCDGIEALYGRYDHDQRARLLDLCAREKLLASAGSDYHGYFEGAYKNPKLSLPADVLGRLAGVSP